MKGSFDFKIILGTCRLGIDVEMLLVWFWDGHGIMRYKAKHSSGYIATHYLLVVQLQNFGFAGSYDLTVTKPSGIIIIIIIIINMLYNVVEIKVVTHTDDTKVLTTLMVCWPMKPTATSTT